MDDGRVPEADMHGGRSGDALQRPVQHRDPVGTRLLWPGLQIGLVELDDIRPGLEQVDRLRVAERGGLPVRVVIVLGLLRHGERARHGDLDGPVGVRAEESQVVYLDRVPAPDRPGDPRHRVGVPAAVKRGARVVDVHAVQRGREPVGVALPAHLAVGDDVQARVLLRPDGQQRRVLLSLPEVGRIHPPQFQRPGPRREPVGEPLAVDQPVRLRVAADERCREKHLWPPPDSRVPDHDVVAQYCLQALDYCPPSRIIARPARRGPRRPRRPSRPVSRGLPRAARAAGRSRD